MRFTFTVKQIETRGVWNGRWLATPSILDGEKNHFADGVGDTPLEAVAALCRKLEETRFNHIAQEMFQWQV